jgi:predicted transcriptional regulator
MAGQGPLAIREIARRAGRDVRAVHSDVRALHLSGVSDTTPEGQMILPYEVIRLDFTLDALTTRRVLEADAMRGRPSRPAVRK